MGLGAAGWWEAVAGPGAEQRCLGVAVHLLWAHRQLLPSTPSSIACCTCLPPAGGPGLGALCQLRRLFRQPLVQAGQHVGWGWGRRAAGWQGAGRRSSCSRTLASRASWLLLLPLLAGAVSRAVSRPSPPPTRPAGAALSYLFSQRGTSGDANATSNTGWGPNQVQVRRQAAAGQPCCVALGPPLSLGDPGATERSSQCACRGSQAPWLLLPPRPPAGLPAQPAAPLLRHPAHIRQGQHRRARHRRRADLAGLGWAGLRGRGQQLGACASPRRLLPSSPAH